MVATDGAKFGLPHQRMPDGTMFNPAENTLTYEKIDGTPQQALEDIVRAGKLTMTIDGRRVTMSKAGT